MSDLRFNSIAGAVLASALAVMGIGVAADMVVHPDYPEKPGYAPEVEIASAGGGAPAAEAGPLDFGTLFADPTQYQELVARGERVSAQCHACHNFDQGGANSTGPDLFGVMGNRAGTHPGFNYSDAMRNYGQVWSYENLDRYLKSPSAEVPGNRMAFAGIRRDPDRAAVIAYLRSNDDAVLPLPAPLPAAVPAETPAPAAEGAAPAAPSE